MATLPSTVIEYSNKNGIKAAIGCDAAEDRWPIKIQNSIQIQKKLTEPSSMKLVYFLKKHMQLLQHFLN